MKLYLGIDGGGTTSRAVLVDASGHIHGEGRGGCGNYHNVGLDHAVKHLTTAARQAYDAAGLSFGGAEAAFLGCAGIKSRADIARLTSAAETAGLAPAGEITVANDLHNALAGGLAGRPGIALIAGTGTHCLGRDETGQSAFCGGWGWLLDDVGGGLWLALAALRAAARAADGRDQPTGLLPAALAFLGLSEADELLARLYVDGWTPDELAAFSPVVDRLATDGDEAALHILQEGADALAELVTGAQAKLAFAAPPEVVILGGCARSGPPYQPLIEAAIRRACPNCRLSEPIYAPIGGAALNALRVGGVHPLPALNFPTSEPTR